MGAVNTELEMQKLQSQLSLVSDQVKAYAENAQKQLKDSGDLTKETKTEVDKLLISQNSLKERLAAMEQATVKLEEGLSARGKAKDQTAGQIVAASEEFRNVMASAHRWKGSFSVPVKNVITSIDGSAGDLIQPMRAPMVDPVLQRLVIRQLLGAGTTTSNAVEYVREEGFTNNAAPVSENPTNPKPESDITFTLDSVPVATIAHWIKASRQVLSDVGMMQSYIDGRLRYGLELEVEDQILNGSGTGLNMNGILNQATAYANPGVVVSNAQRIDQIRIAMLQVQLAEFAADGIVLNPIDWTQIELTKDAENRYLFTNPTVDGTPRLWGLPVVSTVSMAQDDFLVGAFRLGATVWNREAANVQVSTEDRDNFVKNMVTILAETRLALTVHRPEAFVTGAFVS